MIQKNTDKQDALWTGQITLYGQITPYEQLD